MGDDITVRVRSASDPSRITTAVVKTEFSWAQLRDALCSELHVDKSSDVYFVLLDEDGKVSSPTISEDKRFWSMYHKKYQVYENMVFEMNYRHTRLDTLPKSSTVVNGSSTQHQSRVINVHSASASGDISALKKLIEEGAHINARDKTSSTPLHVASQNGHLDIVRFLVAEKSFKNNKNSAGMTPLLCAAANGHLEIVKYLISERVFTFVVDEEGNSALHLAAKHGHTCVVDWLLEHSSVDKDLRNHRGETYSDVFSQASGSNGLRARHTRPPTMDCSAHDSRVDNCPDTTALCRLLGYGRGDTLSVSINLSWGWEDLCFTVLLAFGLAAFPISQKGTDERDEYVSRHSRLVDYVVLIEEDGDEGSGHITDMRKFTKIYRKIYQLGTDMCFLFCLNRQELDRHLIVDRTMSAEDSTVSSDEENPEVRSSRVPSISMEDSQSKVGPSVVVDTIMSAGKTAIPPLTAEVNSMVGSDASTGFLELELEDDSGYTSFAPPAPGPRSPHIPVNAYGDSGSMHGILNIDDELRLACSAGQLEKSKNLITRGAAVNSRDVHMMTPLHHAAEGGHRKLCQLLVAEKAFKNNRDKRGRTPLHCASAAGHLEVVRYLVGEKAFAFVLDEGGNNALHLAASNGHVDVVDWLLKHCDIDSEAQNASGYTYVELLPESCRSYAELHSMSGSPSSSAHGNQLTLDSSKLLHPKDEVLLENIKSANRSEGFVSASLSHSDGAEIAKIAEKEYAILSDSRHRRSYQSSRNLETDVSRSSTTGTEKAKIREANNVYNTDAMLAACYNGDFDVATQLLPQSDPNGVHVSSLSALHLTCHLGNSEFAEKLIRAGASVNVRDRRGFTPLHLACQGEHLDVIETLLQHHAAFEGDDQGLNPLHHAALSRDDSVLKLLLSHGGQVDEIDNSGNSVFHYIVESRNHSLVLWVAENFAVDIYAANLNGISAYDIARNNGMTDICTTLVEIHEHKKQEKQKRANAKKLLCLCTLREWESAAEIMDKNVDYAAKDEDGMQAIHLCAAGGSVSCLEKLIEHGVDINSVDSAGKTAAMHGCRHGHLGVVSCLVNNGCELEIKDKSGNTMIAHAIANNEVSIAEYLHTIGANVKCVNDANDTLLHIACRLKSIESVKFLVAKCGLDINSSSKNCSRESALDLAVTGNCVDIVEYAKQRLEMDRASHSLKFVSELENGDVHKAAETMKAGVDPNGCVGDHIVFHVACEKGNVHIVKSLLDQGASLNVQSRSGWFAIHYACRGGQLEVIRWLKKCGASLDQRAADGITPLHHACKSGDIELVRWLIDRGATDQVKTSDMSTCLHFACDSGNKALVKWLLSDRGLDAASKNSQWERPIDWAVRVGAVDLVIWMSREMRLDDSEARGLKVAASVQRKKIEKESAERRLRKAAEVGDIAMIGDLLDDGVDINASASEDGMTALHMACRANGIDSVEYLLSRNASVNSCTNDGKTALHLVCMKGHIDLFDILIEAGADAMCVDNDGNTILLLACGSPNPGLAKYIVGKYPHFSESRKNKRGLSALCAAAEAGNTELVVWMANNPWVVRHIRYLFIAVNVGDIAESQRLLTLGLDANVENSEGQSPLHLAASCGEVKLISILLDAGAKPSPCDFMFRTPMHYAAAKGCTEIVKILVDNRAEVDPVDDTGMSPLLYACKYGHILTAAYLVGQGADVMKSDQCETTALHCACRSGDLQLVQWLYDGFAFDMDQCNVSRESAYSIAIDEGHKGIIMYFEGKKKLREEEIEQQRLKQVELEEQKRKEEAQREQQRIEERARAQAMNKEYIYRMREEEAVRARAKEMLTAATSAHLLDMCRSGSLSDVRELLACGTDPNTRISEDHSTGLHIACSRGYLDIVHVLVESGADYDAVNDRNETPALLACEGNFVDCVRFLHDRGAKLDIRNSSGECCIELMIDRGYDELFVDVVLSGVPFNYEVIGSSGDTLLHRAARLGRSTIVRALLDLDINVDSENEDLKTPLHLACEASHEEVVGALVNAGANVSRKDTQNRTPLMAAIESRCVEIARLLVQHKADVFAVDMDGNSVLHYACKFRVDRVGKLLVSAGCDIYAANVAGESPLQVAKQSGCKVLVKLIQKEIDQTAEVIEVCSGGDTEWLKVMISSGFDVTRKNKSKFGGLHAASLHGHLDVCKVLLNSGAFVDSADDLGKVPLHYACLGGHIEMAQLLVAEGADVHRRSSDMRSCLHYAAAGGSEALLSWLIYDRMLDLGAAADDNSTALHDACKSDKLSAAQYITKAGCALDCLTTDMKTPFHVACKNGAVSVVEWMLQCDIDIDSTDACHMSGFLWACREGHLKVVDMLYNAGANFMLHGGELDRLDNGLHAACRNGHKDVCDYLLSKGLDALEENEHRLTAIELADKCGFRELSSWLEETAGKREQNRVSECVKLELDRAIEGTNFALAVALFDDLSAAYFSDETTVPGSYVLQRAAALGSIEAARLLVENDVNVNSPSPENGMTPLHYSCWRGHLTMTEYLLSKGASATVRDSHGNTPFHLAKMENNLEILRLLQTMTGQSISEVLESKLSDVQPSTTTSTFHTEDSGIDRSENVHSPSAVYPLHMACSAGDIETVRTLVGNGECDVNDISSVTQRTALHEACIQNSNEVVEFLVNNGAEVNVPMVDGCTALHIACSNMNASMAMVLVTNKADLTIPNHAGSTPLHIICARSMHSLMEDIIDLPRSILRSLRLDSVDGDGRTVLHLSVLAKSRDMVELFCHQGVNVNSVDNDLMTPLHHAVEIGNYDIVQLLLSKGARASATDRWGRTIMKIAVTISKNVNIARLLYDKGAEVDYISDNGDSYLHIACRNKNVDLSKWLVRVGLDPTQENIDGVSAVKLAHVCCQEDLLEWLLAWIVASRVGRPVEEVLAEANTGSMMDDYHNTHAATSDTALYRSSSGSEGILSLHGNSTRDSNDVSEHGLYSGSIHGTTRSTSTSTRARAANLDSDIPHTNRHIAIL